MIICFFEKIKIKSEMLFLYFVLPFSRSDSEDEEKAEAETRIRNAIGNSQYRLGVQAKGVRKRGVPVRGGTEADFLKIQNG